MHPTFRACIVFLVGKSEFNFADQKSLQYEIHTLQSTLKILRLTFEDLQAGVRLNGNRELFL